MRSANGALILVLGIMSLVGFGILTGLPAWIMGNNSLREIDRGMADPNERGLVQAGRLMGMIMTIVSCIGLCFMVLVFAGIIGLGVVSTQTR